MQADALAVRPGRWRHRRRLPPTDAEPEEEEADDSAVVTPLLQAARAELAKLQRGDEENLRLWREFVTTSLAEFAKTYKRLDVHFDVILGESHYHPRLASLVDELLARGIAEPSRGRDHLSISRASRRRCSSARPTGPTCTAPPTWRLSSTGCAPGSRAGCCTWSARRSRCTSGRCSRLPASSA